VVFYYSESKFTGFAYLPWYSLFLTSKLFKFCAFNRFVLPQADTAEAEIQLKQLQAIRTLCRVRHACHGETVVPRRTSSTLSRSTLGSAVRNKK